MDLLVGSSTGVMKPLLSKLSKLLEEEYVKLKGVRKQIKFLRDELGAMSATLQMLEDSQQLNPETRNWRDKLRELAYDLEDCIDTFVARVDHGRDVHTRFKRFFRRLKKLKICHEIADEIKELKARVIEASERHKRYNFAHSSSAHNSSTYGIDPRLPALYEDVEKLVGIDGPKQHIIERLSTKIEGSSAKLKVVSIVGCGGLGKTTLANQVYLAIKSQFSYAAFVSVSQKPDMKKILRDIAKGVGVTNDNALDEDEPHLIDKLREHLKCRRYFVVIDDVWDTKAWEIIKLALLNNSCGSRIISTTRSVVVASRCSSEGGYVYQMKPLSFDDSKKMFFSRVFGSENSHYPHLEDVPDQILGKCDGLPLAINTVSSVLVDQHAKDEWDRVLNAIGSGLARDPNAESMANILSLSFFDLPHHLKYCLLYLSVFPEDNKIEKQTLIHRWIAEGFIHEDQAQSAYEIGEHYFNDLINRIHPIGLKYGQAKACRVHDIILDYIKCKAAEENFITLDVAGHGCTSEHKVRRLCINNFNAENFTISSSLNLCHIRSLIMSGHPVQTSLLPLMALRVLDLRNCKGMEDPNLASIEKLFYLKYLRLESYSVTNLPRKIGDLQYLQTLDVRGTRIGELPSTITKLKRLANLYVDWGTKFPDGVIGHMHSLVQLKQYRVESYEKVKSLQEFSKLTKLRTLKIGWTLDWSNCADGARPVEDLQSYVGTFISSLNIHKLYFVDISAGFYPLLLDSWHPAPAHCSSSLRKLHLRYCTICKAPNWMGSHGNLRVVELYILFMSRNDVEILGAIPSLLFLKLDTIGGTLGRIIVHGNNGFKSLKYFSLVIDNCGSVLKFEAGSMPKLEHLELQFPVHVMECLSGALDFGIQHLSVLSKVKVQIRGNCNHDSNYNPAEDTGDGIIKCVASTIKIAVEALPSHPTISFRTVYSVTCKHFKCRLKELSQEYGVLTEWLKIWQIEEQTEELTAGEAEHGL
ncbi:unnamed protein product [Urochloa decumbens]|uniref:Uncharacterized protein n=1 Tax=Urochloa decumbens TaxID=240449 RepID=A0ABC9BTQ7_9POAL